MARTTQQIQETMDAEQSLQPTLSTNLNSPSQTAIYTLWKYIVSQCQQVLETLWDSKQTQLETTLNMAAVPSNYWLRAKAFEFQYDAITPQIIQLVGFVPTYVPVDITKRIITRCSVSSTTFSNIYLAKNEPPVKLTSAELTAITNYFTNSGDGTRQAVGIGFAGQAINFISLDPDLLFLEATITYNGQFAGTISAETILAITNFISNLGQNPIMRIVDLTDVIQKVAGFVDISITNLSCRDNGTAWGSGTILVSSGTVALTEYLPLAGYMIPETTTGQTLSTKLTFTSI